MHDIMQTIQLQKKGIHLDTTECFHIHKEAVTNNHLIPSAWSDEHCSS